MQKMVNGKLTDMTDEEIIELESVQNNTEPLSEDERKKRESSDILKLKYHAIEEHIYNFYSQTKQSQDEKFVSSYTTKLKAIGVTTLEKKIVSMVGSFLAGSTLEECLSTVTNEDQKPFFEKLLKVGVRTEWCELCIKEGSLAITQEREAEYMAFPTFE